MVLTLFVFCTIHQNVKLLFESINLYDLETTDGLSVQSYQHYIAQAVCNPPMPSCYLGICEQCPGCSSVQTLLQNLFDDNMIDTVTSSSGFQWTGLVLETFSKTADEFDFSCEKLLALMPHSFIAVQQSSYFGECKSHLKRDEVVVQVDFSENYAFILQDSAQGFH